MDSVHVSVFSPDSILADKEGQRLCKKIGRYENGKNLNGLVLLNKLILPWMANEGFKPS